MKKLPLTTEQKEANKLARKEAKAIANKLAKIEKEKNQKEVKEIRISIEWKKSQMWGSNPNCQADIYYKDGSFERSPMYKASGCGYDKQSTVIANVFNDYLKYKLYRPLVPQKHWLNGQETTIPYGIYFREDYKGYSGGIGENCYYDIAKAIGGEFKKVANGKSFDAYVYNDL